MKFKNPSSKSTSDLGIPGGCLGTIVSFITFFLVLIVYLFGVKNYFTTTAEGIFTVCAFVGGFFAGVASDRKTGWLAGIFTGLLCQLPVAMFSYGSKTTKPSYLLRFSQIPKALPFCITAGLVGAILGTILSWNSKKSASPDSEKQEKRNS